MATVTGSNISIHRNAKRHGGVVANQRPHPLDGGKSHLIRHAGKRLADIGCLILAVELAVVVLLEHGIGAEPAWKQATRQGNAGDRRDPMLAGLLDQLDTDAVIKNLALLLQLINCREHSGMIV